MLFDITTETKWYGKGSLKLYLATKNLIAPVVREIKSRNCELPDNLFTKSEQLDMNIGVYAKVWMQGGYVFKWSRNFIEPCETLRKLIVPTVAVTFKTDYGCMWLIVQKKIFGAADFYKMRASRNWAAYSSSRFRHWHNIVCWFSKGTEWMIPRYDEDDYGAPTIYFSDGANYRDHYFRDVHAENIGFDNGQLKVLDW